MAGLEPDRSRLLVAHLDVRRALTPLQRLVVSVIVRPR